MYYLIIKNFGIERCIDSNETDIYIDDQYYSCLPDLDYNKTVFKRTIRIRCTELPDRRISANIYSD